MASRILKWGVLGGAVVVAASALGWGVVRARRGGPLTRVIDNRADVVALQVSARGVPGSLGPLDSPGLPQRLPWTEALAEVFYPMVRENGGLHVFDPVLGIRRRPGIDLHQPHGEHPEKGFGVTTNSLGLRGPEPHADPDLRILVAGDSQTDGVCEAEESFVALLGKGLRGSAVAGSVDAVNVALGGTQPWYYLSSLEAWDFLEPDVFVAVFYGGNDFRGVLGLERVYRGRGPALPEGVEEFRERMKRLPMGMGPVELQQLNYFRANPADAEVAVEAWVAIAHEMARRCAAGGIEFLPVYLPPPLCAQPGVYGNLRERIGRVMPEVEALVDLSDALADRWIEDLDRLGIEALDLRPRTRAVEQKLFWSADRHLNLAGQEVVAEALHDRLAEILGRAPCDRPSHVESESKR